MKDKKGFFERLLFNNKFLMVFSVLLSIVLWMTVKVNFSADSSRTVSNITISPKTLNSKEGDYIAFVDNDSLSFSVVVSGKSYDISSSSFTKDNIIIEAAPVYVDSVGYKTVGISARSNVSGVTVQSIEPSSVTVFYDTYREREINVLPKLSTELSSLAKDGFLVGDPIASMSTVHVSGPATVVDKIKNVFFEADIDESELPLTSTAEISAKISYDVELNRGKKYLKCKDIDEKENPATVTIPVYKTKTVPVTVKFVNEPEAFKEKSPRISISPAYVKIKFSASESDEDYKELNCGTVDFRTLTNGVNRFSFTLDDANAALVADDNKEFEATVNMSSYSKKTLSETSYNIVLLNQTNGYEYSVDASSLSGLTVVGLSSSINNIKAEDLQLELNVSKLDLDKTSAQRVSVSNISVTNKKYDDCWVYGNYTVKVTVTKK